MPSWAIVGLHDPVDLRIHDQIHSTPAHSLLTRRLWSHHVAGCPHTPHGYSHTNAAALFESSGVPIGEPFHYGNPTFFSAHWQRLHHELISRREQDSTMLQLALQMMLHDLYRHAQPTEQSAYPPYIIRLRMLLNQEKHYQLSATELANEVGCSARHLNRLCQDSLGKNIQSLRNAARLEHGQSLLNVPNITLETIAHRTGYADAYSFSKAYKKHSDTAHGTLIHLNRPHDANRRQSCKIRE